jgi:hypothetical protein
MKVLLMHRDRDFDLQQALPWNEGALIQDLELETLLHAMAGGDQFLFDVARTALLSGLRNDVDTIRYRQEILKDCLKSWAAVRELYNLAVETIESTKKQGLGISSHYPTSMMYGSIHLLEFLMGMLRKLVGIADEHAGLQSGRAMARTGLRMMPTSPSSPLKFRTAGFPQYGFKAGLSDGACPAAVRLSLLPAYPSRRTVCSRRSCPPWSSLGPRSESGQVTRLDTTMRAACTALPQGPSLRTGL